MIQAKEIKLVDVHKIIPNPANPNKHPADQIDHLVKQIKYQGFRNPVIVSNQSGLLVVGHGRLEAAKKAGLNKIPVVYQDFETPEQEFAFMVAENATQHWSELDLAQINLELPNLHPEFDIELLGIKDFELEPADKYADKDADEVPEEVEPVCKLGQIWKLGEHRLMCGDSTDEAQVGLLMGGQKADMVFTDPPYGMRLDTDYRSMGSKNNFKPILGDNEDFKTELIQTPLSVFAYCDEIFLFGADYYAELIADRNKGSWVVWDKRSHGDENIGTLDGSFGADFELCWSKAKHQRKMCRVIRNNGAFIKNREGVETMHPSQKPVEMVEWFFTNWAKGLINIIDLFGGSGSTLIACEKTNRKCYMMELDPHYCDVIIARWEKFTGQKAEIVS